MTFNSINPTSERGYLSQDELVQYADIAIDDTTEADDQISQAEEIIDAYVGFQKKYIRNIVDGKISTADSASQFVLDVNHYTEHPYVNYFTGCTVEMLSGPAHGQRRKIISSTDAGVITCNAFTVNPGAQSFYKIWQLGKFPRLEDVHEYTYVSPSEIYKSIPENVKRAVAAQVQYMIEMGDDFFSNDSSEKTSESIGDYSYQSGNGQNGPMGLSRLIAPKAKGYLRGIRCIVGEL